MQVNIKSFKEMKSIKESSDFRKVTSSDQMGYDVDDNAEILQVSNGRYYFDFIWSPDEDGRVDCYVYDDEDKENYPGWFMIGDARDKARELAKMIEAGNPMEAIHELQNTWKSF